ncbi:hypothetical protein L0128_08470 [candidate division KSB1 bacterium]|nr:hypothetical protein [candidate division KSB1 bacterium]
MNERTSRQQALENAGRRLALRTRTLQRTSDRLAGYRLLVFLLAVILGFATYWIDLRLSWSIVGGMLLLFSGIAWYHRRIDRGLARHRIWLDLKQAQVARLRLDWEHIPPTITSETPPYHPYAADLNLTGPRSLHHLLDVSISESGSRRLRDWLLHPNLETAQIIERQALVQELLPRTRFCERFLLEFKLLSQERLDAQKLSRWLTHNLTPRTVNWLFPLAGGMAVLNGFLLGLTWYLKLPPYWLISLGLYAALYFFNRRVWAGLFTEAEFLTSELKKYRAIFRYLEKFNCPSNPRLTQWCRPFQTPALRPTRHLRQLTGLAIAIGLRMNYLTGLILNLVGPWDFACAWYLNRVKVRLVQSFPAWMEVCYELEALMSLANFAYLHPRHCFPQIYDLNDHPNRVLLTTENLGHPLIPESQKKCNDFTLQNLGEIALITGSNMAGKSTFLKTLGINLALAYAGAPVDAALFQTARFRTFTCMKIDDSLLDGMSQFYAEVKRLQQLLELITPAPDWPVFYLIDEIYRGTNNRERLVGSRALIRKLLTSPATGVISTHDLELTYLAQLFPKIRNYHFRETVVAQRMVFDYQLHPGPCPTTNALQILREAGLPVEPD